MQNDSSEDGSGHVRAAGRGGRHAVGPSRLRFAHQVAPSRNSPGRRTAVAAAPDNQHTARAGVRLWRSPRRWSSSGLGGRCNRCVSGASQPALLHLLVYQIRALSVKLTAPASGGSVRLRTGGQSPDYVQVLPPKLTRPWYAAWCSSASARVLSVRSRRAFRAAAEQRPGHPLRRRPSAISGGAGARLPSVGSVRVL